MNKLALIVIPIYLLLVTVVIGYIGSKVKSYKDFALGGGQIPWYVMGGSMIAASIGGGTLIGFVGSYYLYGMQWAWVAVGVIIYNLIMYAFLGKRVKNLNLFTVADMFNIRYGKSSRIIASLILMLGDFSVYCAMLASFAAIFSGFVGISYNTSLIIGAALFIFTSSIGGLKAAAYADFLQSALIIAGVLVVSITTFSMAGGFAGFSSLGTNMTSMFAANLPPLFLFGIVVSSILSSFVSQATFVQKVNGCKSAKDANKALLLNGLCQTLIVFIAIPIMGLGARVLFGDGIVAQDAVISKLLGIINPVIAVLYSAAIIAAVLTTANALLISASMSFSVDLVKGARPDIEDKNLLRVGKLFVVVAGCLGAILVKFMPSVIQWIMLTYTMQSCLFLPLYFGLFSKKPSALSGTLSLVFSGVGVIIWELLKTPYGIHSLYIAIILGIVGIGLGMSIDNEVTSEQKNLVDRFRNNIEFEPSKNENC